MQQRGAFSATGTKMPLTLANEGVSRAQIVDLASHLLDALGALPGRSKSAGENDASNNPGRIASSVTAIAGSCPIITAADA
jgi:hypothetical protein